MGFAGLMYAAIVVAWASFLVPMALRRQDQAARTRSVERFSAAMRVLARSGQDVTARGGAAVAVPASGATRADVRGPATPRAARSGSTAAGMAPRASRAAQVEAAARRRRVLIVLLACCMLVGAASAAGFIPWWGFVVPVVLVVAFLWLARRQVRMANEAYWVEAAGPTAETSHVIARSATRVDASHGVVRADDDDEATVTLTPEQIAQAAAGLAEERVVAVAITTADGESLWDPLPVTLPTYVDKPAARRTIRTVALAGADTWSSGHDAGASQAVAASEKSSEDLEEPAQAVNG